MRDGNAVRFYYRCCLAHIGADVRPGKKRFIIIRQASVGGGGGGEVVQDEMKRNIHKIIVMYGGDYSNLGWGGQATTEGSAAPLIFSIHRPRIPFSFQKGA